LYIFFDIFSLFLISLFFISNTGFSSLVVETSFIISLDFFVLGKLFVDVNFCFVSIFLSSCPLFEIFSLFFNSVFNKISSISSYILLGVSSLISAELDFILFFVKNSFILNLSFFFIFYSSLK
jgi:hypothetical protein